MTSEKPQIRLEEWLEKEGRAIMKSQKLKSLSKAIHKGWRDLKQENEELRRDNKNLREKKRYRTQKQPQSTNNPRKTAQYSKPQQQEQWRVTDEWLIDVLKDLPKGGLPNPFPCPFEHQRKDCYPTDFRACRKNYPSKFEACAEVKRKLLSGL
jgi:hypothetical protein